jgi:hypothetical protein
VPRPADSARAAPTTLAERLGVVGAAVLGLVLRAWGLGYGMPQPWLKPDELRWVRISHGLLEDPNPWWFLWPTLHAYVQAAFYWLWGKLLLSLGGLSWHEYLNPPEGVYPADLVLMGRWLAVLIGTAAIPLAWALARQTAGRAAGLLAALLMAVSLGPVRDAHFALVEPFLLVMILATLLASVQAAEAPSLGRFVLAGFLAGLACSTKYNALPTVVAVGAAVVAARHREGRRWWSAPVDARLLAAGAASVAGFFAGSPFVIAAWSKFTSAMAIREHSYWDQMAFDPRLGFVHHLAFTLRYGHGVVMEVAGIAGLLWLGQRGGGRVAVLAYGLATYLAIGPARYATMRYATPLAPVIVVGAAWLAAALAARAGRRAAVAAAALGVALAAEPLASSVQLDRLLARPDTRQMARAWLEAHLPRQATVMILDGKMLRWGRPLLEDRFRVVDFANRLVRRRRAPYVLVQETDGKWLPSMPHVHALLSAHGSRAVVFDPVAPGARPAYDPHDAFFVPVGGFRGVTHPGPRITIYRLGPEARP